MKTLTDFYRLFPARPALAEQPSMPTPVPTLEAAPVLAPVEAARVQVAPRYRQRDFGTGYGRSSGYARDSYTAGNGGQLLRVC